MIVFQQAKCMKQVKPSRIWQLATARPTARWYRPVPIERGKMRGRGRGWKSVGECPIYYMDVVGEGVGECPNYYKGGTNAVSNFFEKNSYQL